MDKVDLAIILLSAMLTCLYLAFIFLTKGSIKKFDILFLIGVIFGLSAAFFLFRLAGY